MNDRVLILTASFLRSTAMGMVGPLAGFYLAALSFDARTIYAVGGAGLAGAALATALVLFAGHMVSRRTALFAVTLLTIAGGTAAALSSGPTLVGAAAFAGMLNAMGRDRGAQLVIEQAMLPETTTPQNRTQAFAWYSVLQDAGGALGALLAGLPALLARAGGLGALPALRASFGVQLGLVALAAVPYLFLSRAMVDKPIRGRERVSPESRTILAKICALFAIDSFAGGFLASAFLAVFFKRQFGASDEIVTLLFVGKSILNAISHFGAAWLAKRIGLVNTMVFTHIPSSVLLMTVTIAPDFTTAALLFLLREGLVEMDVPTRTSYVMAVVRPEERGVASALTQIVRLSGWAAAPLLTGLSFASVTMAKPIAIAAGMKITYDVALWLAFRRVRPPEE